tara:strand:+ start:593 stop:1000 length:408 start_codon:yes stop_codon:yes gene_type:complete
MIHRVRRIAKALQYAFLSSTHVVVAISTSVRGSPKFNGCEKGATWQWGANQVAGVFVFIHARGGMANAGRTKVILAGGALFTLAFAGMTAVYVPQFSDAGKERRETFQKSGEVSSIKTRPGSMYENMGKNAGGKR